MPEEIREKSNFIWDAIREDIAAGKNDGRVQTRFPPGTQRLSAHRPCEGALG